MFDSFGRRVSDKPTTFSRNVLECYCELGQATPHKLEKRLDRVFAAHSPFRYQFGFILIQQHFTGFHIFVRNIFNLQIFDQAVAVVSWRYRDEAETIADNNALGHLDSITELSANVSYAWSDNRYRVTVFGRNMTDQRERKAGIIGGFTTRGWWNEGSTYGVELSASF